MKLYRYSPIKNKEELFKAIKHIHFQCYKLCNNSFGKYFPNAGNIGVFCHYNDEYEFLVKIRKELTVSSNNLDQKYFQLKKPIVIPSRDSIPETTYTYLYIRRPDPYRHHVGDVDFYLKPEQYIKLKKSLMSGKEIKGARIFERQDIDEIELYDPDIDTLAYVGTLKMTEELRVKRSNATKL